METIHVILVVSVFVLATIVGVVCFFLMQKYVYQQSILDALKKYQKLYEAAELKVMDIEDFQEKRRLQAIIQANQEVIHEQLKVYKKATVLRDLQQVQTDYEMIKKLH